MGPSLAGVRRAWLVWSVALAAYVVAIFHRSSLAVAGLAAAERFDIGAAQLATFTMVQLLLYAAMQIPVGLLVDRWGPRAVMLCGALTMAAGQAAFALADSFTLALGARVLVGVGDAMTWICLLRLVVSWFAGRQVPFLTALSGTLGQLGSIVAAAPMTLALGSLGWTTAYAVAAVVGLVVGAAVLVLVRDTPTRRTVRGQPMSPASVRASLGASWSHPGTRLGFWMHFVTQFSATAMVLLWGFPFLVRGEGRSEAEAGLLLSLVVVAVMYSGPTIGWFIGRHPWHRSTAVLVIVWAIVVAWTLVLAWPGQAPLWLLVVLTQVIGIGGPASMIGFDLARTSNPAERLASANGIINQAGFAASLVVVVAIGLVLDWRTPGASEAYTAEAFAWAMCVQYPVWALGLAQVWRYRRRTRAILDRAQLTAAARAG
jgi:MFS family permease